MKKKILSGFLALVFLLQAFLPSLAYAYQTNLQDAKIISDDHSTQDNLITIGKLKGVGFSKDNPTAAISIEGVEEKNHKNTVALDGLEIGDEIIPQILMSSNSPYIQGRQPADPDKPNYWANVQGKLTTVGLDGGTFDWNKVLGQGAKVKLLFTQTNGNVMTGVRFYLEVDKDGTYTWSNNDGNPTYLPLYDADGNPYTYNVQIERNFSENVQLIIQESNGTPGVSWRPEGDKQVATIQFLDIMIQQVASTKFVSEWHTSLAEADRPQIEGYFKVEEYLDNNFNFPKNDTTRTILRSSFVENFEEDEDNGPWSFLPSELETTPETVEVKTDTQGLTFEEADGVKTVKSGDHKFKYDFTYHVIEGGKLTMTEIIPLTFDANGGKFENFTDPDTETKIVKEVDYEGTLTSMPDAPTKDRETFKGWSTTQDGKNPVTDADFANIKEAKTFYAIWDNNEIQAEELEVFESFKDGDTWVNDFIPTLEKLKGQVKIKDADGNPQPLANDDTFEILNDEGNAITGNDLKNYLYEKLKEKDNPNDEPTRIETVTAKVTKSNGESQTVEIPIKVTKNIYEAKTLTEKPFYVPDGYVKVTVDPTTKAKDPQRTVYYVNPEAKVVIPGSDPTAIDGYVFTKWLIKGNTEEYKLAEKPRYMFKKEATIEAQYEKEKQGIVNIKYVDEKGNNLLNADPSVRIKGQDYPEEKYGKNGDPIPSDVYKEETAPKFIGYKFNKIELNPEDGKYALDNKATIKIYYKKLDDVITKEKLDSSGIPEGYIYVFFNTGQNGRISYTYDTTKALYINPNAKVNLKEYAPQVTPHTGYTFTGWDKDIKTARIYQDGEEIKAQYNEIDSIIPEKNDDETPNKKPDGYVTVTFKPDANGTLSGTTVYYVNPNTELNLKDKADAIVKNPNVGYTADGGTWTPEITSKKYTKDFEYTYNFKPLEDVVKKIDENTKKPKGYVTVTFKADDSGNGTVTETVYYVNPNKYVSLTPPTDAKGKTGYEFGAWSENVSNYRQYKKDTFITASFNPINSVIPEKNPDGTKNDKPDGYVTVTFVIAPDVGGKIADGEIKVYYVNPDKDVTINPPKTEAETGYEFSEWDPDTTTPNKYTKDTEVKGNFKKLEDIIPSTNDQGKPNAKPEGYVTVTFEKGEHGELSGQTIYYVNPEADPVKTLANITKPEVKPEIGYKADGWDKEDTLEIKKDEIVTAKYKKLDDIIPKTKDDDSEKPDGYITVTFVKGEHGKELEGQAVYYVNPKKAVVLKDKAPKAIPNTGYKFARWDVSIDQAIQYEDGAEITALYNDPGNISTTEVEGFVKVEFKPGDNGSLEGTTEYWIKPEVEVNILAPTVKPNVGYKFDKWDKDLTVTLEANAPTYEIIAQYTPLKNIIPQKNTDGSDKPDGYHTVTFKAVNGTLSGDAIYYVKPDVDIDLTDTAKNITKKANVGYTEDGGTWTPAIESKKYNANETYTFTFKALADVIEKIDDSTKKPDGYVTVKVVPTDKAVDSTEKIYYVNPNKEVTIPFAKPEGKDVPVDESIPKAFKWLFTKWTSDEVPTRVWETGVDKGITAKFTNETTIVTANYDKSITDQGSVQADEVTVHESFKDEDGWVNNFIDTEATEAILKDALKVNGGKLPADATVVFLDDDGNAYADDAAFKAALYDKLKEKDDGNKPSRIEKLKAKVTFKNGEVQIVDIPIKVIKNIYEAKTEEGKPNYVPDGYVKVTVDPTTKAENPQKYFYYVNPEAKVVIPGEDPVGVDGNTFTKWLIDGKDTVYELAKKPRHQFDSATTIKAQYSKDVIPAKPDGSKAEGTPDNFVKVTFVPTEKGTLEGNSIFYVNPEKEVIIPVNNPVGKTYYTFKEWKIDDINTGETYTVGSPKQFTANETTITATYTESDNIIPYNPKEPTTRPDGYVRVTFEAEEGLTLTEEKSYYVKANAKDAEGNPITLGNSELVKPAYKEETGYKFDKWDKEDSLVIEAADIVVTAKATKLDNVIPEKKEDGTPNEKPADYKEVTFVIKTGDESKGSITGVAKFYVNPTEYVTINPPATKAETGYEFGAWDKDTTIPTVYDKDTTITGSFNDLEAVIPKTNPDGTENKQPAGYKTVTFVIDPAKGGKIADKEAAVYYVNPAKEVTVPQPKTQAETGYEFEKWDRDTVTTPKKYTDDTEVKGNFKKLEDIIPSTNDQGKPNAKPEGYVTVTFAKGEHGELTGQTIYYVNPKADPAKTLGDTSIVKPEVKAEIGYKFKSWDYLDTKEIISDIKVTAQYISIDDVIPSTNDQGKPNEKPDGYIEVKFSTEENGKIKGTEKKEKVVYVNPNKAVVLKGFDPEVTPDTGYDFAGWDTPIEKKIQYSKGDVIKALYNEKGDVIPQEKPDGSDKPAGYITVTFDKGTNGELEGKTVYYVKPNKEVTVPAPKVKPAVGYEFSKWDKELTQTFKEDTKITAEYKTLENIIPQKNTDGSDKPDGYVTVTFKSDANGTLSGTTVYYVKSNTEVDLTSTADAIGKNPNVGYTEDGGTWTPAIESKRYDADAEYTFKFKPLDDVIPKTKDDDSERPEGYVKVTLIPTDKATDIANKVYFVNPNKEVTITNKPEGKTETIDGINYTYIFTGWTVTKGTIASWSDENIKGTFIQDTEITAQYKTSVNPGELIAAPVGKENVITPVGVKPDAKDLIKNIPGSEKDPLPDGTSFDYAENGEPNVNEAGKTTAKVKVTYPNGKTVIVEVPITVVGNVVPQKPGEDKPNVPSNYVKVTFVIDPHTGGKIADGETTIYYVNPDKEVTVPQPKTVAETGYEFEKWNPDTSTAKKYDKDTTVKGNFKKLEDIIPSTDENGKPNAKPEGYVTVRFLTNDNGSLEGETVYYVNPKAKITMKDIKAPTIIPNDDYLVANPEWRPDLTDDNSKIISDRWYLANYKAKVKNPTEFKITYISGNPEGGKVDPKSEVVKIDGGEIKGSTATPNECYKFVKWIDADGNKVSDSEYFVPTDRKEATYVAIFEKKQTTVLVPDPIPCPNPDKPEPKPEKPETDRTSGKDRIETGIEVSKKYFDKSKIVIIADEKDFPDSMTASVLSKILRAPILLTNTNKLDPRVAAEIKRLGAEDVIIVGGENSISEKVAKELANYDKDTVERLAGKDRYETSAEVARRVVGLTGQKGYAVIASGEIFADALTIGAFAAREEYPILLVKKNEIPESINKAFKELGIKNVYLAGGVNTVSEKVAKDLPGLIERIAGENRFETAVKIAKEKFAGRESIFLANGHVFADALVISPVAGLLDMPILLTNADTAPKSLTEYIEEENIKAITAVGGQRMVSDKVLEELTK